MRPVGKIHQIRCSSVSFELFSPLLQFLIGLLNVRMLKIFDFCPKIGQSCHNVKFSADITWYLQTRGCRDNPRMVPLRSMGTNGNVENHIFQLFPTHSHNYLYYFSGRNPNQFYSLKVSLQQGLFLWELYLVEREVFSLVSPLLLWFLSRLYRLGLALS